MANPTEVWERTLLAALSSSSSQGCLPVSILAMPAMPAGSSAQSPLQEDAHMAVSREPPVLRAMGRLPLPPLSLSLSLSM
ncbi:hypothetical protein GQ53DRAFT_755631 [Thozetella sp. PMI_491]|nr:hypothetical protein GQ53DRAFT_755631 [Thozetella sp. PMI_491]